MTKVKYDVRGVEPGQDFSEPIPVGVYKAKITEAEEKVSDSSGNDMIALTLEVVGDGKFSGRNLWDYVVLTDEMAWKQRQFVDALALPEHGSVDLAKIVGKTIQVRVRHESDSRPETLEANNDKPVVRARVGSLLPMPDGAEPEEEADEEEGTSGEDYTYEDIAAMDLDELKEVIESEELSVRVTSKSKVETVRSKVADALDLEEEEEPEEPDEEEEELDWDELSEYGRADMEALIEDNELEVKFTKRTSDDLLRERIAEELGIEAPEEEEEDEEEEEADYSTMSIADLKNECKERGIRPVGSKKALIRKLEKSDKAEEDGDPF